MNDWVVPPRAFFLKFLLVAILDAKPHAAVAAVRGVWRLP